MRKLSRNWMTAIALAAALAVAPGAAQAVGYEDSLDECDYPQTFDLLVMRPVSFFALTVGTLIWLPAAPLALLTVRDDFYAVTDNLIGKPARFTFRRRLGECVGVSVAY